MQWNHLGELKFLEVPGGRVYQSFSGAICFAPYQPLNGAFTHNNPYSPHTPSYPQYFTVGPNQTSSPK